jgi:hypothetical protein
MGTQASKLPRRSRSASRVVGGVLGAVAREVVGDRCDGVLCALGQSRSTHGQSFERGAQRPAGVVGVGPAKKEKKVATGSGGLAGEPYGDVAAARGGHQVSDILEISRDDCYGGGVAESLGDRNDKCVDAADVSLLSFAARLQRFSSQDPGPVNQLRRDVDVGVSRAGEPVDHELDQGVTALFAGVDLGSDDSRDTERPVVLVRQAEFVAGSKFVVMSELGDRAAVKQELAVVTCGHSAQEAASAISAAYSAVKSTPCSSASLRFSAKRSCCSAMKAACATGSSKLPLLEPLRCGSFGIPQIVARNSDPGGVFVPMSTMDRMSSNPTSCLGEHQLAATGTGCERLGYLIGAGVASPGKTSRVIDPQMGCSRISKDWRRLALANTPFENLSVPSIRDVFPGELVVKDPR